jgi:hypothetical protein
LRASQLGVPSDYSFLLGLCSSQQILTLGNGHASRRPGTSAPAKHCRCLFTALISRALGNWELAGYVFCLGLKSPTRGWIPTAELELKASIAQSPKPKQAQAKYKPDSDIIPPCLDLSCAASCACALCKTEPTTQPPGYVENDTASWAWGRLGMGFALVGSC